LQSWALSLGSAPTGHSVIAQEIQER